MRQRSSRKESGIVILEVLVAVLIFSIGILGLINMQANAIKQAGDAKLRSEASYLAGQIISQVWVDRSNLDDYAHQTTTDSACVFSGTAGESDNVTNWIGSASRAGTVLGTLPNPTTQILVETGTGLITVTVCWRAPQETTPHNFTSTAVISG
jgi:type IV pilus assembly protein PilV